MTVRFRAMSRPSRRTPRGVTIAAVGSLGLLAAGLAAIAGTTWVSPAAAPTTIAADSTAPSVLEPTSPVLTIEAPPTSPGPATTENPGFDTGAEASLAAEQLLAGFVESEFDVVITEPACSTPPTGAVGETFVCFGLKPDELVIALRASIGEEQLVSLELITNQQPTTTTTTAPPAVTETTTA